MESSSITILIDSITIGWIDDEEGIKSLKKGSSRMSDLQKNSLTPSLTRNVQHWTVNDSNRARKYLWVWLSLLSTHHLIGTYFLTAEDDKHMRLITRAQLCAFSYNSTLENKFGTWNKLHLIAFGLFYTVKLWNRAMNIFENLNRWTSIIGHQLGRPYVYHYHTLLLVIPYLSKTAICTLYHWHQQVWLPFTQWNFNNRCGNVYKMTSVSLSAVFSEICLRSWDLHLSVIHLICRCMCI